MSASLTVNGAACVASHHMVPQNNSTQLNPVGQTSLHVMQAAPAVRRLRATKDLVACIRTGTSKDLTEEAKQYFGVASIGVWRLYGRLIEGEFVTYSELAQAAGDGPMLTAMVRAVLRDCPEIMTPFDSSYAMRRKAYSNNWREWDGKDVMPGKEFTELAMKRTREANARAGALNKSHPLGDSKGRAAAEAQQWIIAEQKLGH